MSMDDARIDILIAGGRKLFREGLCALLERRERVYVVGDAEAEHDVPRLLKALPVDIVILNVPSHQTAAPDLIRTIHKARSGIRVIILTIAPSIEFVHELLDAGAAACLTKECATTELLAALDRVLANGRYLSQSLLERVVSPTAAVRREPRGIGRRPLAPREQEILRLIAAGRSTKEIAQGLKVSSKTVETHRHRIMEKLKLYSVAELTKYAVLQGLSPLEIPLTP
jgi:DNA-binding NarL/FixJ family response regulator